MLNVKKFDAKAHKGILKLWMYVQVERGPDFDKAHYKRLCLQTIYGVPLEDDKESYVLEFKDLNPAFEHMTIRFDYTLKQIG